MRWISHFRAQFSRDRQQSFSNSSDVLIKIPTILDAIGRSNMLPRQTREHRVHLADTVSVRRPSPLAEIRRRCAYHHDFRFLSPASKAANIFSIPSRSIPLPSNRR